MLEYYYCVGVERDFFCYYVVRDDWVVVGSVGRYGGDGVGDSECVKIVV